MIDADRSVKDLFGQWNRFEHELMRGERHTAIPDVGLDPFGFLRPAQNLLPSLRLCRMTALNLSVQHSNGSANESDGAQDEPSKV